MHHIWFVLLTAASATRLESFKAGLHATQEGDADVALSHFRAAVNADGTLGKDDVSLHLALGEALSRAGAHAEAVEHLQQALELCDEHELGGKVSGAVQYNLAVALEDAGGEQAASRAEELYRGAAEHGLSPALYNLAVLVGNRAAANATALEEARGLYDLHTMAVLTVAIYWLGARPVRPHRAPRARQRARVVQRRGAAAPPRLALRCWPRQGPSTCRLAGGR